MNNSLHIVGFSGSLRKGSYNRKLLEIAEDLLPEEVTYEIVELNDLPLYNEDVEKEGFPPAVRAFRDALQNADSIVITSPEYNSSVTGVLKNALDWASRGENGQPGPLVRKPVAIMGAGGRGGTDRSQTHLRSILSHMDMYVINKPEVLINLPGRQVFDEDGNLLDEFAVGLIAQLMKNLVNHSLLLIR